MQPTRPESLAALPDPERAGTVIVGMSFVFSSRRRHTRCLRDWSSDVCSSDLTAYIPQQAGPAEDEEAPDTRERDYHTGQFAFVEEPADDSEDVIDWLNFTENRTERREEAKRRARSRLVALVVVLALVAAGGVGYLWYAGKLPGVSSAASKTGTTTAVGAQNRDVIVVHLHNTSGGGTSTALLVDNTTTKQGTTVLVP